MTSTDADAIRRSLAEPAAFGAVFDRHFTAVHGAVSRQPVGTVRSRLHRARGALGTDPILEPSRA